MKVRAVSVFLSLAHCNRELPRVIECIERAQQAASSVAEHLTAGGYEVQTTRVVCDSFERWAPVDGCSDGETEAFFAELASALDRLDVGFFNVGPATTPAGFDKLRLALASSERISGSLDCTAGGTVVDEEAVAAAARLMVHLGQHSPGGGGNFRFCATFGCEPGIAFFPAGFAATPTSPTEDLTFALGLENGDVAVSALAPVAAAAQGARPTLDTVRTALHSAFSEALTPLEALAKQATAARYLGIDTSLNPGLDPDLSVGRAMELALGGSKPFGSSGTLAVAATITSVLKSLPVQTVGYSGLMLPPLEDVTLAARASQDQRSYGITELLSYSAVCGVGLDTVPVPGDCSPADIAALLCDVAALSVKWRKQLSCRLFPVPGLAAGDLTTFDSPYMINMRVLPLP